MRLILRVLLALCLLAPAGIWAESSNDLPVTRKPSDLQAVSFEDWDGVLEKQLGHITVVDFWAGWCSPCIERFPHMVEMHHQYKDRGVRFILGQ
jgi:thiol-disulfide isomerase/thioredoxin